MLTSVIVSVFVLATGIFMVGPRPPWALQPAMAAGTSGGRPRRRARHSLDVHRAVQLEDDEDSSIVMDSLRALGLVRRRIERPVTGQKAYVRVWERVRAIVVLAAIIATIGVLVAGTVGIIFLTAGFLLEQAIS